jgi:hypothetical protein
VDRALPVSSWYSPVEVAEAVVVAVVTPAAMVEAEVPATVVAVAEQGR